MNNPRKLPESLGIIMDGNGRWAQLRGKPRSYGHIKGARVAKKIITECSDLGLKSLVLYAFSTENWLRPKIEVNFLLNLLRRYLRKETENLVKKNIRFSAIGDLSRLPLDLLQMIDHASLRTSACTGLHVYFAISYGARMEITEAVRQIAEKVEQKSILSSEITEEVIDSHLMTPAGLNPDLIIRTSGECRLSNFLLWQAAYSELYFTNTLWPDFELTDLHAAFASFSSRNRRFGEVMTNELATN